MARVWMCWMDWINPSFWGWLLWLFIPYKIDHQSSRGNWSDTSPGFDFTTVYLSSEGMWCRNCHRVTYWTYWTKHVFTETSCVISLGVLKKWETQPRFFLAIAMGTWSTMAFWGLSQNRDGQFQGSKGNCWWDLVRWYLVGGLSFQHVQPYLGWRSPITSRLAYFSDGYNHQPHVLSHRAISLDLFPLVVCCSPRTNQLHLVANSVQVCFIHLDGQVWMKRKQKISYDIVAGMAIHKKSPMSNFQPRLKDNQWMV